MGDNHTSQKLEDLSKREPYKKPQIVDLGHLRNVVRGSSGCNFDSDGMTFTPNAFPGTCGDPDP